jgi:hypothetical protein
MFEPFRGYGETLIYGILLYTVSFTVIGTVYRVAVAYYRLPVVVFQRMGIV